MLLKLVPWYLLLMNALGLLLMHADKQKARRHQWRIPEATLLWVAALGGSLGSLIGMSLFRHKTKHIKFVIGVPLCLILQIGLGLWWLSRG